MEPKEIKWSCVICLERNYPMTLSPCGHGVCKECVKKIDKCPECRESIVLKQPNYELGRILGLDYVIEVNKDDIFVLDDEIIEGKEESLEETEEEMEESLEETEEEIEESLEENNEEYMEWEISLKKMLEDGKKIEKIEKYQNELRNYHNKSKKYAILTTFIVEVVLFIVFVINLFMKYGGVFGIIAPIAFMSIYMFVGYWISEYILKKTCIRRPTEIVYN